MSDKKRFIKKILLLVLGLLVIIPPLNYLGTKTGNIYKDGAALVCQQKRRMIRAGGVPYYADKKNVLFMGTSRILAGIVPIYFDQLSGGKTFSFNLAFPALTISSSYFALTEYLEKNPPPQYILVSPEILRCKNCAITNYYAVQGIEQWHEIFSLFKNLEAKSIILNYLVPFRMYKFFAFQYVKDRLFNPQLIAELQAKNQARLFKMESERGYYYIEEQARDDGGQWAEEMGQNADKTAKKGLQFDPFEDPYMELFFDLTARYQIKVMLIQPAFREGQYQQYQEMPYQYAAILKRYDNVRVATEGWKMKIYKLDLFADPQHLNKKGALLYTGAIYKDFKDCFN